MVKNDSAQCQVNVPCGLLGVGGGGSYLIHPNPHGGEGVSVASSGEALSLQVCWPLSSVPRLKVSLDQRTLLQKSL
jgi:hypothetical protein